MRTPKSIDRSAAIRPVVLCILDGWGHRENGPGNAIAAATTPHYDRLLADCPHALLETSGAAVGLPEGQMGNSEVGHMNIGAGRVVLQDLPRIDRAIESGEFAQNPALRNFIDRLSEKKATCHMFGLVSPGGVHSHQAHMAAAVKTLTDAGVAVAVHAFLDGRDTPPKSAAGYMRDFEDSIADCQNAIIGTVSGRYWAMDRDRRWDRTERAFNAIAHGEGIAAPSAEAAISDAYAAGETDEFVAPRVIAGYSGLSEGDGLFMANFRADRVRQILSALVVPEFSEFDRGAAPKFSGILGMVSYSAELDGYIETLFPPMSVTDGLGEVVAAHGLSQLRLAETEKYAHVTFFLNGGREEPFEHEDRILVPSPKVATYDLQPEMSAREVTDKLVDAIAGGKYDLIVVNYANPDMVGHTGKLDAAVAAVEVIDECLGRVCDALEKADGAMLLTADHGNVEQMTDATSGEAHTAHTERQVPVILYHAPNLSERDGTKGDRELRDGCLADIAPTILTLLGIDPPAAMTGTSLLAGENVETGTPDAYEIA